MSADPNKKSARTFQCRDVLWETFEQMARELECSIDYLINESMKQYARQRSYSPRTPFPPPARVDAPPGSGPQALANAHQPSVIPPNPPLPPPGTPPPFGGGASPMVALQQQPAYGASPGAPAYAAPSPPYGVPPAGPVPTPVPALTPPPPPPPGQVRGAPPPPPPPGSSNAGGKRPSLPVPPPIPGRLGGPPPPTSVTRLGAPPPLPSQASGPGGRQSIAGAPAGRSGPPPPPPLSSVTGYASPIGPPMTAPPYGVPPPATSSVPGPPPMGMGMPGQVPAGPALAAFYAGQRFVVNKDRFIIGRGKQSSDLTIKDPNVSRQHAMVEFLNGQYYMVDMGSTNGVEYNGQRIARKAIVEGDLFRICDHEVRFSYR
ncbi:FHA domain-containing protein [Sorangium sp. So ce1024]|uniref:FHA domain-containing protein n=1 Tax=Sorangium sp. So ce1024 TaxID=3133327 RepID=UPI003EFCA1A0